MDGDASSTSNVRWMPNPYRQARATRLRRIRLAQGSLLAVVVAGFAVLASLPRDASGPGVDGLVAVTFLSLLLVGGMVPFSFPKFASERVFTSPVRVGVSAVGIHVDYDPSSKTSIGRLEWARSLIPWSDIGSLEPPPALWGQPSELLVKPKGTSVVTWRIVQIDPAIVHQLSNEWRSRTAALG